MNVDPYYQDKNVGQ